MTQWTHGCAREKMQNRKEREFFILMNVSLLSSIRCVLKTSDQETTLLYPVCTPLVHRLHHSIFNIRHSIYFFCQQDSHFNS
jgi:hypothetical protein